MIIHLIGSAGSEEAVILNDSDMPDTGHEERVKACERDAKTIFAFLRSSVPFTTFDALFDLMTEYKYHQNLPE